MGEQARINDVVALAARFAPGYRLEQKTSSRLHRALGAFMGKLGNPGYLNSFWTTTANLDGSSVTARPASTDAGPAPYEAAVLAHEVQHAIQAYRPDSNALGRAAHSLVHSLSYLFPQIIGIAAIPLIAVACGLFGWWGLLGLAFLATLGPWPARWRTAKEIEGYRVSLAMAFWKSGGFDRDQQEQQVSWATRFFIGPDYYRMSWNEAEIRQGFNDWIQALRMGASETQTPYLTALRELAERYRQEDAV